MANFIVSADTPLLPDPDESSKAILTLAAQDRVTLIRTLDIWSKVSFTDQTGAAHFGWVQTAHLEKAPEQKIQLFAQPFAEKSEEVTGSVVATLGELAGAPWKFVRVKKDDGVVVDGWLTIANDAKPVEPPDEPIADASPKKGDLALGANSRYRDALLKAQELTGIDAAALAALVNAEAAKISSGPDKGVWNPRSHNADSGAAGLTQFLASTWLRFARLEKTSMKRPTTLNRVARERGYVTAANAIAPNAETQLLELRFDPELSIISGAELGAENLAALIKAGVIGDDLADDDLAPYCYLAHHEGLEGAKRILSKTNKHTVNQLAVQVGGLARAQQLTAAANGDPARAYRDWLNAYIDQRIQPQKFRRVGGAPVTTTDAVASTSPLESFDGAPIPFALLPTSSRALVAALQQKLTDHGYLDPPADGAFGRVSNWAIEEFCARNGLDMRDGFTKAMARMLVKPTKPLPTAAPSGAWFDKVIEYMNAKGYFINRHPDCKNIVYLEGMEPNGALNENAPNKFNDIRVVFSCTEAGGVALNVWDATTEPGAKWTFTPMNASGAARIAFGQYKSWGVGVHKAGTKSAHEALVQVKPVRVYRDLNRDFKREGDRTFEGLFGINQHWGYDLQKDNLGTSSAGCLVGRTTKGHREFLTLVKSDPRYVVSNGYRFMTAVMPAKDVFGTGLTV